MSLFTIRHRRCLGLTVAVWLIPLPGFAAGANASPVSPTAVTISTSTGGRQQLMGIGAGANFNTHETYNDLTVARREELSRALWGDLGFNAMRIWLPLHEYTQASGQRDLDRAFTTPYLDLVQRAQAHGVDQIIVTGDGAPAYMRERRTVTDGHGNAVVKDVLKPDMIDAHANALADYVQQVRDTHGITVSAITLQNEPHSADGEQRLFFNAELFVPSVKALRTALDTRGLDTVKIVGPESANADGIAAGFLRALKNDPVAWDALNGIATHSYNMAATRQTAAYTDNFTKEYWQTEASSLGPEGPNDVERGASISARFLNDMNHGVTHWLHFIGFSNDDPNDNGTRILKYANPDAHGETTLTAHTKAHYFDQLTDAFDIGATFRKVDSSLEGDMVWSHGRKPRIVSSTARNPDGTWALGVVNFTSDGFSMDSDFERENAGYKAEAFEVTLHIEELAHAGTVTFQARISGPNAASGGEAYFENDLHRTCVMQDGYLTLTIQPLQLITLRSLEAAAVPEPSAAAAVVEGVAQ